MIRKNAFKLVSILLAVWVCSHSYSCKSSYHSLQSITETPADCLDQFKPNFTRALYSAQVEITRHNLSGLLLIKQMPDSSTRLVFTQNSGFKFFDFEFAANGRFTVHYIMDKMDKKAVIKTLQSDFATLLMLGIDNPGKVYAKDSLLYHQVSRYDETDYFITDRNCTQLIRAEKTEGRKPKMTLTMQDVHHQIPGQVDIVHQNFHFHIALHLLDQ